jgi:hypothetical protein
MLCTYRVFMHSFSSSHFFLHVWMCIYIYLYIYIPCFRSLSITDFVCIFSIVCSSLHPSPVARIGPASRPLPVSSLGNDGISEESHDLMWFWKVSRKNQSISTDTFVYDWTRLQQLPLNRVGDITGLLAARLQRGIEMSHSRSRTGSTCFRSSLFCCCPVCIYAHLYLHVYVAPSRVNALSFSLSLTPIRHLSIGLMYRCAYM